ncbi:glycoside hydrolase family 3 protein [Bacillus sp. EB600]|uniref:glycoside hydrolase family 3 protein n=1 Tax=Bacillus sp. EB600 TaxID=2806345 RepID=UPI00210D2894|nr:glycoside hydrolase family 3 protein [Bacillus sp. EB600]MCQ6280842.1 glycoside hydrolase family 3 protein [Bacillus sp. EB600]
MNFGKKIIRRLANLVTSVMAQDENTKINGPKEIQDGLAELAGEAAAEGIVLLKNQGGILPLAADKPVSVFGRVQIDYFTVGYGSGGDVKAPYTINLLDGLRENPTIQINKQLAGIYEAWCGKNKADHGSWGHWPRFHQEMPIDEALVMQAAEASDVAIVVIGRGAGEDRENVLEKGSYYLSDQEVNLLDKVTAAFKKVVVLLNCGSIIDMSWVEQFGDRISSILYVWQGGMESGRAVANVLSGAVTPSGKLTATIANRYKDYPSFKNFGNMEFNNYVEDIFVGYRYFETFAKTAVKYPFGYGLSYTYFEIEAMSVAEKRGKIFVDVIVKNRGDKYAGKEVVQVYYGAPQGVLGKAVKSLVAYGKTKLLQPGESQGLTLVFDVAHMASYDDGGKTGYKSAFVLEAGDYPIYVGNNVRTAEVQGIYTQPTLKVIQQFAEAAAVRPEHKFERMVAKADRAERVAVTYEPVPTVTTSLKDTIQSRFPKAVPQTGDKRYKLIDVKKASVTMGQFIAQLSLDELEALCRGDYTMNSPLGTPGNAAVFGGVLSSLRDKGVVPVTTSDGPSGIRLSAYASLLPIGTNLACTWNEALVERLHQKLGAEMINKGSHVLLSPGMNIQRDPLCGRNFEYFSEDPLLTGRIAVAFVRGIQSQGVSACPKHFACNNQETNRTHHDSRLSERALREIYLKGFEICVKEAKPQNMMTSYNKINGVWGHYHYELCTIILREQWGYKGNVMTDWWMQPSADPNFPKLRNNAYRVRAQVDVLMPGGKRKMLKKRKQDPSLLESYDKPGGITLGEMQRCAANVLRFVMISAPFAEANGLPYHEYKPGKTKE